MASPSYRLGMKRLSLLLVFSMLAFAEKPPALDAPLPIDPALGVRGRLENGFVYWIKPNKNPESRVEMQLRFGSGSLDEADDQRGLAHFIEHMAFNGSKHFPPGSMVEFFESMGMVFGQHQNAFTGFDQTAYVMSLPNTNKETIEKTLLYFGDVANGLLFEPVEIEKERGVIMEEKRTRSGAQMRILEQLLPVIAPGSRLSERFPIGLVKVIQEAKRDRFVAYYKKWYRPENATLLIAGDVDPKVLVPMIEKTFSGWKAAETPAVHGAHGIPENTELRAAIAKDPELTSAEFSIGIWQPYKSMKTIGDLRESVVERASTWILRRRLRKALQEGKVSYQSASASVSSFMNYRRSVDAQCGTETAKWKAGARDLLLQVRKAHLHGFAESELAAARKAFLSQADRSVRMAPTTRSNVYLARMAAAVGEGRLPMSPAQSRDLLAKILPTITTKDVHAAFQRNFAFDVGLVTLTIPEKEGVTPPKEEELLALVAEVKKVDVKKDEIDEGEKELYAPIPEPVSVVSRVTEETTGVTTLTLENGVVVHIKTMDVQKDRVSVNVRFNGGAIEEDAKTRGLSFAAGIALQRQTAATERHSPSELSDALTGKQFGVSGGAGESMFNVSLRGSSQEIDEGFRLLHLKLTEARVVRPSLERWRAQMLQLVKGIETQVAQQAGLRASHVLTGDDPRFGLPSAEQFKALTVKDAQAWLDRILKTAPIEAAIVGDITLERAEDLARRFLGALPKRSFSTTHLDAKRKVTINKGPLISHIKVKTITPQSMVRLGFRGAPRGDRVTSRRLYLLSQILTTRLNTVVREEKSLTYSIQCGSIPSSDYDGTGNISAMFMADPAKVDAAAKISKETMLAILTTPPTDDEMAAVHKKIANVLDEQFELPTFWLNVLTSMISNGRTAEDIGKLKAQYAAITRDELLAVAKEYFVEDRYYEVIARPG